MVHRTLQQGCKRNWMEIVKHNQPDQELNTLNYRHLLERLYNITYDNKEDNINEILKKKHSLLENDAKSTLNVL